MLGACSRRGERWTGRGNAAPHPPRTRKVGCLATLVMNSGRVRRCANAIGSLDSQSQTFLGFSSPSPPLIWFLSPSLSLLPHPTFFISSEFAPQNSLLALLSLPTQLYSYSCFGFFSFAKIVCFPLAKCYIVFPLVISILREIKVNNVPR